MSKIIVNTEKEMVEFGKKLAGELKAGDILLLEGELGAGKTTLVKGIAAGLGVKEEIKSPTFSLMNVYKIPASRDSSTSVGMTMVHIDTYRLKDQQELLDIGAQDYLGAPETICVIEWPEKIAGLLKDKKTTTISIEHSDKNSRSISYSARLSRME